jgi:hypothetical protein
MAEQNAESTGSFPLHLPTLLVLLTVASGAWLVSQKLTSTRPALGGKSRDVIGEQRVEARLWEDPFKLPERDSKGGDEPRALASLRKLIEDRVGDCSDGWILPVMIPGGFYSEDQESRIRSRFAIVSALGQSGYVPVEAEQIETVTLKWPTTQRIKLLGKDDVKDDAATPSLSWQELYKTLLDKEETPTRLRLRYEWYRQRVFYPGGTDNLQCPYVFVLWLNERAFESEPLLRLSLLLGPIREAAQKSNPKVRLIGPYFSATLRAMLPGWEHQTPLPTYPPLRDKIRAELGLIDVYSATATAMDATLVRDNPDKATPRDSVREVLTDKNEIGFHSFQNFAATDNQLASEMLKELALRDVNFAQTQDHLVLISEWDTFYARMLELTYAVELAMLQKPEMSRDYFINQYRNDKQDFPCEDDIHRNTPCNLHSFVYLRGLDGQTVENESGAAHGAGGQDSASTSAPGLDDLRKLISDASKDDLRKWTPDANKAEGPAQFDYLSRLGEQLAALEKQLSKKGEHIKAIGVVGSDVYDTLLILQALRHQVPNALFFTTGLDARFWHPRELSWSRNLLVTSSYGLTLHPNLQKSVPPFRDSWQTAQFAAALAALEHLELPPSRYIPPRYIPPRRFEIGKRGAVDLSVVPGDKIIDRENSLHPSTTKSMTPRHRTYVGLGIVGLTALLSLTFFCGPLRQLVWEAPQFQADTLRYQEEDVGGTEGAWRHVWALWESAKKQEDSLSQWLSDEFKKVKLDVSRQWWPADTRQHEGKSAGGSPPAHDYTVLLDRIEEAKQSLDKEKNQDTARQEIENCKEELRRGWVDFLNSVLHRKSGHPGEAVEHTRLLPEELKAEFQDWWPAQQVCNSECPESLQQLRHGRNILDALLQKLSEEPHVSATSVDPDTLQDIREKAHAAREASLKLYKLHHRWVCQFRIVALTFIALAIGLIVAIWRDTFFNTTGELFSLTTGTSAWPAEVLRFAAFVLAVSLSFHLYYSLRTMMFQLTRRFRLPRVSDIALPWLYRPCRLPACRLPASPATGTVVHVSKLWQAYQQYGTFGRHMCRLWTLVLYIMFSIGLIALSHAGILNPLRGPVARPLHRIILFGASLSFLFLTFMTIDTVRLCKWFIQNLGKAPTKYPLATTNHFSRMRGDVDRRYLDEWIDIQLIADLTAQVGRLVYYPFIVFFLLLLARNEWWERWPWPWPLITIFVLNLMLAAASVIILQNAARQAKNEAIITLEAKVKRLQAATAESQVQNNANQAKELLEEIRALRRGAFVPLWENPVFRAILLPSGGTVVLQILIWLMSP